MKTTTFKKVLFKLALLMMIAQVSAQDLVGTRIDVQGTRFSDQMWVFSVASCTYNFDNGWDGYKMFGTSMAPQLFVMEPDGYYQVASIPDVNNTYLGFSAGIDSVYTFTFTHQNLTNRYKQLYLIDSVSNKVVDIYTSGTKYSFKAQTSLTPIRRFKIVTSKPVDLNQSGSMLTNVDQVKSSIKNLRIYYAENNIYIENTAHQKGMLMLLNAQTGRVLKTEDFKAEGTSIIKADVPKGIYVVNGVTLSENVSEKIIIN
jgi:hypothetical protein